MKQPNVRSGRLQAEILSGLSAAGQVAPPLARLFGQTPHVRWKYMRGTPADSIAESDWQRISGCDESGVFPSSYADATIITFNKQRFDDYMNEYGGRQAYAYRLGNMAVMAGFSTDPENPTIFQTDPDDSERYSIAGGIGRGVLLAAVGVVSPGGRKFSVPPSLDVALQRLPRQVVDPKFLI